MIITQRILSRTDRSQLQRLLSRIAEFDQDDQHLALELVDTALENPDQKDYYFVLAYDDANQILGYACYGPTPITDRTFDLYWIAVDPGFAGQGIGSRILKVVEEKISEVSGRMLVIETSSAPRYELTRKFYLKNGYVLAETLKDFFQEGEDRVTYLKKFTRSGDPG